MTHSLVSIDPFYAACLKLPASSDQRTARPLYAKLPRAPITGSPVPHRTTQPSKEAL